MTFRICLAALLIGAPLLSGTSISHAGISYTTVGSLYQEEFDGLPTLDPGGSSIPTSGSLEGSGDFPDGWQDDVDWTTSPEVDLSVLGWHLHHPTSQGEGGFNGNQRFRMGTGNSGIGAFYGFASGNSATPEKALGLVNSSTLTPNGESAYIGLQLINNTGQSLNRFTLTFDGEQWRDGAATESLLFSFSTAATDSTWLSSGLFTTAPTLDFNAPITANNDAGVDGNSSGKVANITATLTNFTWAPGTELWLRWADIQAASANDDGLALDSVRFTADAGGVFGSNDITSVQTGLASAPSTWSDNQTPTAGKQYRVAAGHTVSIDGPFAGDLLRAVNGATVLVNSSGNGADIKFLIMDVGSTLTHSVSGDVAFGEFLDPAQLGTLVLNQDQTITASAGGDVTMNLALNGPEDLDVVSSGAGSDLWIANAAAHSGVIRFGGTGDNVVMFNSQALNRLEMNSTGANTLQFNHQGATGGGTIVFSTPGRIEHITNSNGSRLVQKDTLVADAAVTVDLSQTYAGPTSGGDERRLNFTGTSSLQGAGNVTVVGTSFDPTSGDITLNEFELGSTSEPGTIPVDAYSGILTTQNYVNAELRHSMPAAKIVVGDNSRVETGHQAVNTAKVITLGEVQVAAGGTFEVGFEQVQNGTGNNGTGHHVGHVDLVNSAGRAGSLSLTNGGLTNPGDVNSEPAGSMLVMQVNGKDANQYDSLSAGTATLDGVLKILINPTSSIVGNVNATPPVAGTPNSIYTPALGDVIPLITSTGGASLGADFDHNNTVNGADLGTWKTAFGSTAAGDADADGDSDGEDFLRWQRQLGQSAAGGLSGTFDSVVFVDVDNSTVVTGHPDTANPIMVDSTGVITGTGLKFQVQYSSNAVNLVVVSAAIAAIPEPSTALLCGLSLAALAAHRRRSR